MSVLLIPNPTKDAGLAVTRQAAAVLAGLGVQVLMPQTFAGEGRLAGVQFLPEADAYRAADQVVTIGGDGTLLRAGLSCMRHGKPVLGVNLGRMGFLATCEVAELPTKLQRLAAEDFTLVNRGLLHAGGGLCRAAGALSRARHSADARVRRIRQLEGRRGDPAVRVSGPGGRYDRRG